MLEIEPGASICPQWNSLQQCSQQTASPDSRGLQCRLPQSQINPHTYTHIRLCQSMTNTLQRYLLLSLSPFLFLSSHPLLISPPQKRWAYLTLNRCSVFTLSALVCVLRACQIRACKMPADSPSSIRRDILSVHLLIIEQCWSWRGAGWVCHEGILYLLLRFGLNGTFSPWEQ